MHRLSRIGKKLRYLFVMALSLQALAAEMVNISNLTCVQDCSVEDRSAGYYGVALFHGIAMSLKRQQLAVKPG